MIKAVIFDLFGTLVDSPLKYDYWAFLHQVADVLHVSPDRMITAWNDSSERRNDGRDGSFAAYVNYLCEALGVRHPTHVVGKTSSLRADLTSKWMVPRDDAAKTLGSLKERNLKIGLISDASYDVPVLWEDNPLKSYFNSTIFSCSVKLKKPDPRIFQMSCDELEVQPNECVYVGDGGSMELTGSGKFGMRPIRISAPGEIESELHRLEIDDWVGKTIGTLSELIDVIGEN